MAFTITTYPISLGNLKGLAGTFTSAEGDSSMTLAHGLNWVAYASVEIDTGGVGVQRPKITHSAGTMTVVWDDTLGYSGQLLVIGK